jgi:hypothetical protein
MPPSSSLVAAGPTPADLIRNAEVRIRWGTDEFAQSQNRRGFREVTHRRQILPQQILRHLYGIDDYAIGTHEAKQARRTLTFWVVRTA